MAVFETNMQSLASPIAKLALLVDRHWVVGPDLDATVREFLELVKTVANEEQPIKIRVVRLLAWAKTKDVQQAGYPSWSAFVKEYSPWRASRTRDYLRLIESDLDVIKAAVAANEIDVTLATRAPKELGKTASTEAQVAWMLDQTNFENWSKRHPAFMDVLSGKEMREVVQGRKLGAFLIGSDASPAAIDDFLIDCHARSLTSDQILEGAREAPPKPDRLDKKVPDWNHDGSEQHARGLVGEWVEPTDLTDCVAKLRAMEMLLSKRRVLLGMAYWHICDSALWTCVPECTSLAHLCVLHLGMGQRSFQRYAREGLAYIQRPVLRKEVEEGRLTTDRAMFVVEHCGDTDFALQSWMELARLLGRAELQYCQERDHDLRRAYGPALETARKVEALIRNRLGERGEVVGQCPPWGRKDSGLRVVGHEATEIGADGTSGPATEIGAEGTEGAATGIGAEGTEGAATGIGGAAERIADHLLAVGATGSIQIALRQGLHEKAAIREPAYIFAPPKLWAAAVYLLRTVVMPREYGARRMVDHDRYTCQNPRCRRRSLRVHPHHMHQRQHGGTDDPWNLVTLCPACHLRGIHSGNMSVVRIDDFLVWWWPDGGAVIMSSPVSDLVYEPRASRAAA